MQNSEKKNVKRWIDSWQKAETALKNVKRQELRSFDYKKNFHTIDGMLQWAFDNRKIRLNSGLVAQQEIFSRIRNNPFTSK